MIVTTYGYRVSRIASACVRGLDVIPVTVEAELTGGLPGLKLVGVPEAYAIDMRSTIRSAIREAGLEVPRTTVTVRIGPESLGGSVAAGVTLAIVAAVLEVSGQIAPVDEGACLYADVEPEALVRSALGSVAVHQDCVVRGLACVVGAGTVTNPETGGVHVLHHIAELRQGIPPVEFARPLREETAPWNIDDVDTTDEAKDALKAAMAERRNIILTGDADRCLRLAWGARGLQAETTREQRDVAEAALSLSGVDDALHLERAVRPQEVVSPHYDSLEKILGGGRPMHPGAMTHANGGTLVLRDEASCAKDEVITAIAHAAREGGAYLTNAYGSHFLPADVQVIICLDPNFGTCDDPEVIAYREQRVERYQKLFDAVVIEVPKA